MKGGGLGKQKGTGGDARRGAGRLHRPTNSLSRISSSVAFALKADFIPAAGSVCSAVTCEVLGKTVGQGAVLPGWCLHNCRNGGRIRRPVAPRDLRSVARCSSCRSAGICRQIKTECQIYINRSITSQLTHDFEPQSKMDRIKLVLDLYV